MSTYGELIYICIDLAKAFSDDVTINEDHIRYLLDKYRSYLLLQKFSNEVKSTAGSANYQTIELDLMEVPTTPYCLSECLLDSSDFYLRTVDKLPNIINVGNVRVTGKNMFKTVFTMIPMERMEFVGNNKWLNNIVYCTIAPDKYLYLKSANSSFKEKRKAEEGECTIIDALSKIYLTAIFESPLAVAELQDPSVDINDVEFPIEDYLVSQLIALVLKDILGALYRPKDDRNNANDDLSTLANFISSALKDRYGKQVLGADDN